MTSYWKPRWPNTVFFGSYAGVNYRIDIRIGEEGWFRLRAGQGPGFAITLARAGEEGKYEITGRRSSFVEEWLSNPRCRTAVSHLLDCHFSTIEVCPGHVDCYCLAGRDVLPEGSQLGWCMKMLMAMIAAVPESQRRTMQREDFLA